MTSQATLRRSRKKDFALAKQMAADGYGVDDLVVVCGVSRREARLIVFGKKS
jgi:hypothetical protein